MVPIYLYSLPYMFCSFREWDYSDPNNPVYKMKYSVARRSVYILESLLLIVVTYFIATQGIAGEPTWVSFILIAPMALFIATLVNFCIGTWLVLK